MPVPTALLWKLDANFSTFCPPMEAQILYLRPTQRWAYQGYCKTLSSLVAKNPPLSDQSFLSHSFRYLRISRTRELVAPSIGFRCFHISTLPVSPELRTVTCARRPQDEICFPKAKITDQQCPAGSRDLTRIPIWGFLKIKSRDFSGFWYSTEDDVYKDFYLFSDS